MPMYRYKCPEGHETVSLEKPYTQVIRCPECGHNAYKGVAKKVASRIVDRTGWTKTNLPGSYEPVYTRSEKTVGKHPSEL